MTRTLFFFFPLILFATPPQLPVPAAGIPERELQKEFEAEPLQPEKEIPAIQIDIPEKRLEMPLGRKVYVSSVRICGNTTLSYKKVDAVIAPYLQKKQNISSIYQMCKDIDALYAQNGYFLARSYPPPQDIIDGVLTINVIEGKLGSIEVIGNRYYSTSFIQSYFSSLQNQPLQEKKFLKALMLLNENSDLNAAAIFEKGKQFGYADVILKVVDKRPIHLYLNGNNYGRDLTTNARAGARFDVGNLIVQGDMLSVAEVVGFPFDALNFSNGVYKVPLNRKGLFLELAYLFSEYHIEEHKNLHLKGMSNIATLKCTQKILRTKKIDLDSFGYFDYKQIKNISFGSVTSYDKLRTITVGSRLDYFREGFSRDLVVFQFAAGIPNFLGGLKAVDDSCSRKGGGGRFFIWTADYDRIQYLPYFSFLYLHGSFQLSPNKLTAPEQIYIGGVDTVRGFPLATGVGDSGYYFNAELRSPIPGIAEKKFFCSKKKWKEVFQLDAFLDHGATFMQSIENLYLWGAGIGARLHGPYGLEFSIDVGFPLNHRDLSNTAFTYIKLTGQPF